MQKLIATYKAHFNLILASTIVLLASVAWSNRFILDDALISYRYSAHLAGGYGLVWNIGQPIEGYTNFLWTLLLTIPHAINIDPISFAQAAGVFCFILALSFTYKTALLLFRSRTLALLTICLLGANYSFNRYAASGMETLSQASIFIICFYLLFRSLHTQAWPMQTIAALSLGLSAAILTRPDSALFLAVIFPAIFYYLLNAKGMTAKQKLAKILTLMLPFTLLVGGWLLWKLHYYGDILPNTFYAKSSSHIPFARGAVFILAFFLSYLLFPFPILALRAIQQRRINQEITILLALIMLWLGYVLYVGGDFMEFRFMVPILPPMFIVVVWLIFFVIKRLPEQQILLLIIILGLVHHPLTFHSSLLRTHQVTIAGLQGHLENEAENWDEIGKVIGAAFHYSPDVTIAVTPSGAIPYYSGLQTIDMLGLNDDWVARNGLPYLSMAGHERIATFEYLLQQKVNLLIGHPQMERGAPPGNQVYSISDLERFLVEITPDMLPVEAKIIAIPITANYRLVVLYLNPHPLIDNAIEENGWQTYRIDNE